MREEYKKQLITLLFLLFSVTNHKKIYNHIEEIIILRHMTLRKKYEST
nr:hypothetical protein BAR15_110051 [Bartonella sp. AR 15-3]